MRATPWIGGRGRRQTSPRRTGWVRAAAIGLLSPLLVGPAAAAPARAGGDPDLAATYTCVVPPNYWGWKGPVHRDHGQLTDGVVAAGWDTPEGPFYALSSSLGWAQQSPVLLFDLGDVRAIGGISLHSALSIWGPYWPEEMAVLVSDDRMHFYLAAPRLRIQPEDLDPPLTRQQVRRAYQRLPGAGGTLHWYRSPPLAARGRYVGLIMGPAMMEADGLGAGAVVLDEVEIHSGPETALNAPRPVQVFEEGPCGMYSYRLYTAIGERLSRDLHTLRTKVAGSPIREEMRKELLLRLDELAVRRVEMPVPSIEGFRAVLPVNDLHREVFSLHAALWRAQGAPGLRAWKGHRWDPLSPFDEPRNEEPRLRITMAQNAIRSEVLNLSVGAARPLEVRISFRDLPAEHLDVFEVPLVDTAAFEPVASALLPLPPTAGAYRIRVSSGMTRQIWIRCASSRLAPGTYEGTVLLAADPDTVSTVRVPLTIDVLGVVLPSPSLAYGFYDYPMQRGYNVTDQNVDQYVAVLQDYGVNLSWESSALGLGRYDADGQLIAAPSRDQLEGWLSYWPDASTYGCMESALRARSDHEIAAWCTDWDHYLQAKGIPPERMMILIQDEPTTEKELSDILRIGRIIKGNSRFKVYNSLQFGAESAVLSGIDAVAAEACDVQAFNVGHLLRAPRWIGEWMQLHSRAGVQWWCYGNAERTSDPYVGWLLRSWFCFQQGLAGVVWWIGDPPGTSSWNEYGQNACSYSPLYVSPDSVTPSKSMEAMREGAQDYEILRMLQAARSRQPPGRLRDAMDRVLTEDVPRVLAQHDAVEDRSGPQTLSGQARWSTPKDRSPADAVRARTLQLLEVGEGQTNEEREQREGRLPLGGISS